MFERPPHDRDPITRQNLVAQLDSAASCRRTTWLESVDMHGAIRLPGGFAAGEPNAELEVIHRFCANNIDLVLSPLSSKSQMHKGALWTANGVLDLCRGVVGDVNAVDAQQHVARLYPSLVGGSVVDEAVSDRATLSDTANANANAKLVLLFWSSAPNHFVHNAVSFRSLLLLLGHVGVALVVLHDVAKHRQIGHHALAVGARGSSDVFRLEKCRHPPTSERRFEREVTTFGIGEIFRLGHVDEGGVVALDERQQRVAVPPTCCEVGDSWGFLHYRETALYPRHEVVFGSDVGPGLCALCSFLLGLRGEDLKA
mmetsp:Transcript_12350/g.26465  ORF Transcript_12350/g.26465 Transcript_12350/m.26465 type:complete len:313 (-) Transcript_12350:402-1340(-)